MSGLRVIPRASLCFGKSYRPRLTRLITPSETSCDRVTSTIARLPKSRKSLGVKAWPAPPRWMRLMIFALVVTIRTPRLFRNSIPCFLNSQAPLFATDGSLKISGKLVAEWHILRPSKSLAFAMRVCFTTLQRNDLRADARKPSSNPSIGVGSGIN